MTARRRPVRLHWAGRPEAAPPAKTPKNQPLLEFAGPLDGPAQARLFCADAIDTLDHLLANGERVDVIHLDPPFGSAAGYARRRTLKGARGDAELRIPAYSDVDGGDVAGYLEGLYAVLCRAHDLLAAHGSLYLHIDYRRGPHLRLLLDEIFGADALLNEIVWAYALGGSTKRRFQRKHDTIFLYAREPGRHYFAPPREEATSSMLAGRPKLATGTWVTDSRHDEARIERDWPDELVRKTLSNRDPERTGYGTQKPLALAMRMVTASCPPGGLVVDPMCGSGTIGVAARLLGRRTALGDRGDAALDVTRSRLLHVGGGLSFSALGDALGARRWPGAAAVGCTDGVAALNPEALRGLAADFDGGVREAIEAEPALGLGAWAVGQRRPDGGIEVRAFTDNARLRGHGAPASELQVAAAEVDTAVLCDVLGRRWWLPL